MASRSPGSAVCTEMKIQLGMDKCSAPIFFVKYSRRHSVSGMIAVPQNVATMRKLICFLYLLVDPETSGGGAGVYRSAQHGQEMESQRAFARDVPQPEDC